MVMNIKPAEIKAAEPKSEPIVLRWRIHKGEIPLRRRHLKALDVLELPGPLRGWIHERLEWAIINLLDKDKEGVLVLSIDPKTEVKISLDEVQETPTLSLDGLVTEDGLIVGVQKDGQLLAGSIWVERADSLYASVEKLNNATDTLTYDLAKTLKISAIIEPQRLEDISNSSSFLISDEFGFVPLGEKSGNDAPLSAKIEECFLRLW
jgi:hypothetical protein